ncbi:MAG: transglycosylase SLT domain-containing protein [Myxococcota bacterium]|nr:transglycosylase SLT domain-containing protein [Myxococcota bacterium]
MLTTLTSLALMMACNPAEPEPVQAVDQQPPEPPPPPSHLDLSPVTPAFERSAELDQALADQDWAAVAMLTTDPQSPQEAFVHAWARVELGQARAVVDLVDRVDGPQPYLGYLRGRLLHADGRPEEALAELLPPEDDAPLHRQILAWRASCLEELGRADEATLLYARLIQAPDPADGSAHALAQMGGPEAHRRIWAHYPDTPQDNALGPITDPTWQEATHRAAAYMNRGMYLTAIKELEGFAPDTNTGEDACLYRYVKGRSLYKKNKRSEASAAFGSAATDCVGTEIGPQVAYLSGRNEQRLGNHRTAAGILQRMAQDYPEHSYADDGLVMAGESLEKAGDLIAAQRLWSQAAADFPEGDMVPEALWRLAWSHYEQGHGDRARQVAQQLGGLDPAQDHFHVPAGRYWAARWALYPDVNNPTQTRRPDALLPDPKTTAVAEWSALVQDLPWSYYAVLASSRIAEEDPAAFSALPKPPGPASRTDWPVPYPLTRDPALDRAQTLLSYGLHGLARDEIRDLEFDDPTTLWWSESRSENGDWLNAHRELRVWVRSHVPSEATPDTARELAVAYPNHWLPEVQEAADGYRFPPRYFQGLVRVESNFNEQAVSWAGARGLCQVMPATGKSVGNWLGLKVGKPELLDPAINLQVGARYMDHLHKLFNNSPYLSAAGYNAGENRILQWIREDGNLPTDEFVERIPFDETRGYVKRVVGTWAAYGWLRDGEGPKGLDAYNHTALPER